MAEKKKKGKDEEEGVEEQSAPLEQLILDKEKGKYQAVDLISEWAKELRKLEEHRHLTQAEIIDLAMSDVLSGRIGEKEIRKRQAASSTNGAGEEAEKPAKKK